MPRRYYNNKLIAKRMCRGTFFFLCKLIVKFNFTDDSMIFATKKGTDEYIELLEISGR